MQSPRIHRILTSVLIPSVVFWLVACVGEDAALRRAVRIGDLNGVRQCLMNGADINAQDDYGYTPLMAASGFGNEAIVRLLLKNGADVNARDTNGRTALNYAWAGRHYTIVGLLKACGATDEGLRATGSDLLLTHFGVLFSLDSCL